MNTTPHEQFRRELNMNAGNRLRYFLVIYELVSVDLVSVITTAPAKPPDEPAAWRAQCAAYRGESEDPPFLSIGRQTCRQVRKNTNQMTARIRIASPVEMASSAATDGPGSPWRASVAVSTI
jgi:hypothetical protein